MRHDGIVLPIRSLSRTQRQRGRLEQNGKEDRSEMREGRAIEAQTQDVDKLLEPPLEKALSSLYGLARI